MTFAILENRWTDWKKRAETLMKSPRAGWEENNGRKKRGQKHQVVRVKNVSGTKKFTFRGGKGVVFGKASGQCPNGKNGKGNQ